MKKKEVVKKCNERGISLVALAVTIIILLLLAGITVNYIVNTGVFNMAQKAGEEVNKVGKTNKGELENLTNYLKDEILENKNSGQEWIVETIVGAITNTPGGTSLNLSINVTDPLGGMAKVIWYYKEQTEEAYISIEEAYVEINETETGYLNKVVTKTIEGLVPGATYKVYAEICDVRGNKITAEEIDAITDRLPKIGTVTYKSKTTGSITVQTTATDEDGDKLRYTIYTSPTVDGTYTARGSVEGESGANVTLTASGLSEYTNYYYYVDVTDSIATDEGAKGANVRTYCPGNHLSCSGGGTTSERCWNCGGSGSIRGTCGGNIVETGCTQTTCPKCGINAYSLHSYTCSSCGAQYTLGVCTYSKCDYVGGDRPDRCTARVSSTCSSCGGDGYTYEDYTCTHGYYSSHRYCSHGRVGQHD